MLPKARFEFGQQLVRKIGVGSHFGRSRSFHENLFRVARILFDDLRLF